MADKSKKTTQDADVDPNREAFERLKDDLLKTHEGKFALFHEGKLVDVFDSMDAAYVAGVDRFGLDPVFIAKVVASPSPETLPALQHGLIRVHS